MAGMVRRNRKIVNYSEFGDFEDGDEDFACVAAPLTKKSRIQLKELKTEKKKQKTQKELTPSQNQTPIRRTSLDDSFCERDLNVTLALSVKEKSANILEVQSSKEQDEESEKDSDYSEGNDEDCAMEKMKIKGNETKQKRQTGKKKKTPKSENYTTVMELKSEQTQKKMSKSSEPVGRPLHTSSPATIKKPKWVPPAASGRSNNSMKYASVKSPTLCLRLGLSRLARVKPLHPSATSS
ncbi:RAD51-associated protein 1 isoform X2 [Numida meleagris]|uniref:RAD51-associated protein 1 isoform X2 n=1 Tax=Numida meleagris TaxID=8996 RepID=UPI000B3DE0BE|nr:RAD51-associated protein 1 isoform X2 [Numida meleagris]